MRKRADGTILIIHALQHAGTLEIVDGLAEARALFARKDQLRLALLRHAVFRCAVNIAIGVTRDGDRFFPGLDHGFYAVDQNRRAEDRSVQNRADGAVWALPHLGEVIFRDALGVGRDGCAFDANAVSFDRIRRVGGYLIAGFLAFDQTEIIVFRLEIDKRQDQLVLDLLPENASHLVPVHLDERFFHLNQAHIVSLSVGRYRSIIFPRARRSSSSGSLRAGSRAHHPSMAGD
ncbi:hypothetical protein SDC9_112310 [bioreactor metagenome]|uniref:Uncharacterized protein n=1 Tax=bioreactor metagenome TaxID=1076179 RepID=A0A645BUE2_9ZZZZ